jgi:hypothetical protein
MPPHLFEVLSVSAIALILMLLEFPPIGTSLQSGKICEFVKTFLKMSLLNDGSIKTVYSILSNRTGLSLYLLNEITLVKSLHVPIK